MPPSDSATNHLIFSPITNVDIIIPQIQMAMHGL